MLDATPLLGTRTGIGRYVEQLGARLPVEPDLSVSGTAFTVRGAGGLRSALPTGVRPRARPAPARLLRALWSTYEFPSVRLVAGRSDVFHGTNFVLPPLPRRTAGVLTVHDLSFLRVSESVHSDSLAYRTLVPRGIRRSARVITPSRAVADEVVAEYGLAEQEVVVTHLGVGDEWFAPATRPADLPADYYLAVGTLEPRKGLGRLVAAHRELRAQRRDVPPLVLVGPPGWGPGLGLTDQDARAVHLTGYLDDERLRGAVAGARCLVFPSLYEGFGLPPLEALAAGTAVIASDLAVTREVLGDQATFATAEDDLGQSMADALDGRSAGTPASRVERARSFRWDLCAARTAEVYRDAAATR